MLPSAKTLVVNATVVTALVGGGVAYITLDNAVTLNVDGKTETVHTFGSSVEDVLDDQGIEVSKHDEVIPTLGSSVEDGTEISVRYGRQITVTVDGEKEQMWTTARSVDEALGDLDIRHQGADLSVARSQPIGRGGIDFTVRTSKDITLVAGGKPRQLTTTALTVRQALSDAEVKLGERDRVKPGLSAELTQGDKIRVQRVKVETETVTAAVPFETTEQEDDTLEEGTTTVETEGENGTLKRVIRNTYIDGKLHAEKVVSEEVVDEPVDEVVLVGTKEPETDPAPDEDDGGGDTGDDGSDDSGDENIDGGVWDSLAECESGGDWSINTGNGYYGGLQFNLETWQAYGGSGYPHENSKAEQIRIAEKVRDDRGGYGAWPACAAELGLPT
ncbi:uncharacterized protein YabE (DUF348 family) [Haloactinopolyspora alba]|uniref:Uncharacterized protein YabE (DUF348 family) n=1 Tax=Haloactinopolyspora alba TaxID=648780 RepID=A0A2P8E5B2_9ACTN|nr:resuscitation-promoting factor [Haloactinopolyspora alba]PSL04651.1 uncharacterized protein YabE (DUF348 family) [Haloactinopolyspora alba]